MIGINIQLLCILFVLMAISDNLKRIARAIEDSYRKGYEDGMKDALEEG